MEQNSFAWKPSLSVGNKRIDTQHRTLIEMVNSLTHLSGGDLKEPVEFLLRYTFEHFSDEESLMEECGYPDLELHRKLHTEFCGTMAEHYQAMLAGTLEPTEFQHLAYSWVTSHIMNEDVRIGVFLKNQAA